VRLAVPTGCQAVTAFTTVLMMPQFMFRTYFGEAHREANAKASDDSNIRSDPRVCMFPEILHS
jgi:hypothetical protein